MKAKQKRVLCKSGHYGRQDKLRRVFSSFREFFGYCEIFRLHKQLGFSSPEIAWKKNPIIKASVLSSDFETVPDPKKP